MMMMRMGVNVNVFQRSDCREAIATAQMKRMEAGEELEKKRNQFKDEMERKTKDMMNMVSGYFTVMHRYVIINFSLYLNNLS